MIEREYNPSRRYYQSDVLSKEVLYQQGNYQRVRRFLRGWQPDKGVLIWGLTGKETVEEADVIYPLGTFEVEDAEGNR